MTPCTLVATASPDDLGLVDAMHSQRAIRYCKPDPIPNDLIQQILEAAIFPVSQAGELSVGYRYTWRLTFLWQNMLYAGAARSCPFRCSSLRRVSRLSPFCLKPRHSAKSLPSTPASLPRRQGIARRKIARDSEGHRGSSPLIQGREAM